MTVPLYNFIYEITVSDQIQILLLFATSLGLFITLLQMRVNNRQKTAEAIIALHNQYYADADINDIYYKVEYGDFKYDGASFPQSPEEKKLDKLLSHYDNIGKLYLLSNFKIGDLDYIAYRYLVVYQDESVRSYLNFLDTWYAQRGIKVKPFGSFKAVGALLELQYFNRN